MRWTVKSTNGLQLEKNPKSDALSKVTTRTDWTIPVVIESRDTFGCPYYYVLDYTFIDMRIILTGDRTRETSEEVHKKRVVSVCLEWNISSAFKT